MRLFRYARPLTLIAVFMFLMVFSLVLSAQQVYIENQVIYNFETEDEWQPISNASKFMLYGSRTNENGVEFKYPSMKLYQTAPLGIGALSGTSTNSLGVQVSFFRKAYNFFDLIPSQQKSIPGKVKSIDVWVWGGNYDYTMEVLLSDYMGYTHALSFGSLKFMGWRNLSVLIPSNIPQTELHAPRVKGLKFLSFRFWSSPQERNDRFTVFLDYCKVVTDIFREVYDGADVETILAKENGGSEALQYSHEPTVIAK